MSARKFFKNSFKSKSRASWPLQKQGDFGDTTGKVILSHSHKVWHYENEGGTVFVIIPKMFK